MRRTHLYVAAAVATVGLVAAFRTWSSPEPRSIAEDQSPTSTVITSDTRVGPASVVHGVARGWSPTRDGALAAAVSAVGVTGDVARAGFITRADMIRTLATGRFAPILGDLSANQLDEMISELTPAGVAAGSVTFTELALTAHVASFDEAAAVVEVWSVTVISVGDVAAPRQVWRTITVELAWEHDDWRVDGWTAVPGPTPALDAAGPIASGDDIATVVAWAPVGLG